MKRNKGFTLIELLVVIAIIGILSSIVLVSLNTARNKANDARVQSQLASMRAAAEIYYSGNGTNGYGVLGTGAAVSGAFTKANPPTGIFADTTSGMLNLASSTIGIATTLYASASSSAWIAEAQLSSANSYWCVDSTGVSKATITQITPGITAVCPQ